MGKKKPFSFRLSETSQNMLKMAMENNMGDDMTEVIEYALLNYMWEEQPDIMRAYIEQRKKKIAEGFEKK